MFIGYHQIDSLGTGHKVDMTQGSVYTAKFDRSHRNDNGRSLLGTTRIGQGLVSSVSEVLDHDVGG